MLSLSLLSKYLRRLAFIKSKCARHGALKKARSLWLAFLMVGLQSSKVPPGWRQRAMQMQATAFAGFTE